MYTINFARSGVVIYFMHGACHYVTDGKNNKNKNNKNNSNNRC